MNSATVDLSAEVFIDVPFYDVDVLEVAWHGHYAKYFEVARGALMDKIQYNYREMRESGYAWPVIELNIRYPRPARLGQKIKVKATIVEYEVRLKIAYLVTDAETGVRLTKAHTIQAAVDLETREMLFGSPKVLLDKIGAGPCDP